MSSFVIAKSEYMKAAGFCAALAEKKNRHGEPWLRLWDPEKWRVAGADDYKKYFSHLYRLNAASVAAQYKKAADNDNEEYSIIFDAAKANTATAALDFELGREQWFKKLVFGFYQFCRSALYQIEEERAEAQAAEFLHKLIFDLFPITQRLADFEPESDTEFWGSFDTKQ